MSMQRALPFMIVSVLVFAGCDAQVDPSYRGEPLVTVRGEVVSSAGGAAEGEAVLAWWGEDGSGPGFVAERVPFHGTFPASFTMPVYAPPPADGFRSSDAGERVAWATPVMTKAGADLSNFNETAEDDVLGYDADHVIVYVEDELLPGGEVEKFLGARLSPGFHVVNVVHPTPEQREASLACVSLETGDVCPNDPGLLVGDEGCCPSTKDKLAGEAPDGFDTPMTIVVGARGGLDLT